MKTLVGASLSEPHINGSALREIYIYVYMFVWYDQYICCSNLGKCKFSLMQYCNSGTIDYRDYV